MSRPFAIHSVSVSTELARLISLFSTCFASARTSIWPTEEYLEAAVKQRRELRAWAALVDEQWVGAALVGRHRDGARIESVGVIPGQRRQGIGAGMAAGAVSRPRAGVHGADHPRRRSRCRIGHEPGFCTHRRGTAAHERPASRAGRAFGLCPGLYPSQRLVRRRSGLGPHRKQGLRGSRGHSACRNAR